MGHAAPHQFKRVSTASPAEDTLGAAFALSRRVSSLLRPVLKDARIGVDFSNVANLRVTDEAIVLYVKNAWQKTKLRQMLPRLDATAQDAGFTTPVTIVVRPEGRPTDPPRFASSPRTTSPQAARTLEEKAGSIIEPALRKALENLAKTLRGD